MKRHGKIFWQKLWKLHNKLQKIKLACQMKAIFEALGKYSLSDYKFEGPLHREYPLRSGPWFLFERILRMCRSLSLI